MRAYNEKNEEFNVVFSIEKSLSLSNNFAIMHVSPCRVPGTRRILHGSCMHEKPKVPTFPKG